MAPSWDVASCSKVDIDDFSEGLTASVITLIMEAARSSEDGGDSKLL
jgi:hypothetical protein